MINIINKLFTQWLCSHKFIISKKQITYHILENTNSSKIVCDICGKVKDYKWVI